MTATRDAALASLLRHARAALDEAPAPPPASRAVAERVFRALETVPVRADAASGTGDAGGFPACAWLPDALAHARAAPGGSTAVAGMAHALEALAARLSWQRRPGAERGPQGFFDGHANAVLVGPRGLERRTDVMVGLSLVAPRVRYPDHHHPPEEYYVVMSRGEWRQRQDPWHEPGIGGIVHNPPGIVHAMRAGEVPLLAVWFLWTA